MSDHTVQLKISQLADCKNGWHQLVSRSTQASPFLAYEWFFALERHLLQRPCSILTFWRENALIGIAPMEIVDDTLTFVTDERVTDHCDIICDPMHMQDVIAALATMIMQDGLRIELFPVQENSPLTQLPLNVRDVRIERADVCPFIRLPGTWDRYLESLGGKQRHELRRKLRKAAVTLTGLPGESITVLFELMAASDPDKHAFLTPRVRDFFRDIALAFETKGWLRLQGAYVSEKPISVLFSFQAYKTIYLYNSGFDPDAAHLSPGIVSISQDIRSAIEQDFAYYDFLRGDEKYKYQLGAEDRYTVRLMR